jgi:5-methyltetrahydrofolate--homocysteine methyltransferase
VLTRDPRILQDEKYGEAARELFGHGQKMLQDLIQGGRLRAKAVYGFWAAESQGDDIVLFEDASRSKEAARFCMLREQKSRGPKDSSLCLSDFIAPAGSGVLDHIGAFAVTAGIGAEEIATEFEEQNDDYSAIMVKALADRLAEALAEYLHACVRKEWGYELDAPSNEDLIAEKFRGIRPAFGYPACPDHKPKRGLFELLRADDAGMALTESCAMTPAAAVSGLYFAHPQARYFNVGRIARDQLEDYSRRMGQTLEESEKWLQSNLGYNS